MSIDVTDPKKRLDRAAQIILIAILVKGPFLESPENFLDPKSHS